MKVCRKCKKKLANKTRICNRCGADVSKCKIIKNNSQVSKKENNIISKKNEESKNIKQNDVLNIKLVDEKVSDDKKQKLKDKKKIRIKNKKEKKNIRERKSLRKNVLSIFKNVKIKIIIKFSNIKSFIKKKKKSKKDNKIKEKRSLRLSNKKLLKDNQINKGEKNKKEKKLKEHKFKINKKDKIQKIKSLIKDNKIFYFVRKKNVKIAFVIIIVLGLVTYISFQTYNHFFDSENTVVVGEEATNNKLFAQGDIITYKGVNYQVLGVETSEGNSYKSPKEGNIFLIVTVQIENNTSNKIDYSYKNWTMSNSLEEEEKRIFTSINVDTALYSGELVIGGIKRGSMVFEQPKDDKKLKLNFYELKETKDGKKDIDKDKKVFSVSIKVPKEVETTSKTTEKE